MRILEIHIINFGHFENKDFDFSKNSLTQIIEKNGFGKSTIVNFIKTMFYGISHLKNDYFTKGQYEHYYPLDKKGDFGGYVDFEYNSKSYRLKRVINSPTKDNDTIELLDLKTKKKSNDFDLKSIGLSIFKVDSDGFDQLLYVPQYEVSPKRNATLKDRLINTIAGIEQGENKESILKLLDLKIKPHKELKSSLNKETDVLKKQIQQIGKKASFELQINSIKNNIKKLEKDENDKNSKLTELKDIEQVFHNHSKLTGEIKSKQDDLNNLKKELDDYKNKLNNKDFTDKDIGELNDLRDKLQERLRDNENYSNQQEIEFPSCINKEFYIKNVPTIDKIDSLLDDPKEVLDNNVNNTKKQNKILQIFLIILGTIFFFISIPILLYKLTNKNKNSISNDINNNINKDLLVFRSNYCCDTSISNKNFLLAIRDFTVKYNDSCNKSNENIESKNENDKEISKIKKNLDNMLEGINFKGYENYKDKIAFIVEIKTKIDMIKSQIDEKNNNKNNYKISKQDKKILEENDENEVFAEIEKLGKELLDINKKITEENGLIDDLYNKIADIESIQDKININNTKINEEEAAIDLVNKTKEYINTAFDSLTDKYTRPLRKNLESYIKNFKLGFKLNFNSETDVVFEKDGSFKTINYLSDGLKSIVDLCVRLSAIKELFKDKEKAFLILDDSFKELDEDNFKQATKVVKKISEECQIIYFSCRESRKIK